MAVQACRNHIFNSTSRNHPGPGWPVYHPSGRSFGDQTQSAVQAAIEGYIIGLPIGATLSVTRISQIAYQTEARIINISNVTLNGQPSDLVAAADSVIHPSKREFRIDMGYDQQDIQQRIKAALPSRWFGESTPVLDLYWLLWQLVG